MIFRDDIQILRGISVLWVVFYHFGFSAFQSGFLGVDAFFVISGFLMASLYTDGKPIDFYRKRANRLLPAYFAIVFLTLGASLLLTTPNESDQVITQSFWALAFSSNIGFWTNTSYFAKAYFTPLLHLWSLGVEIQFYLLVPLLWWVGSRSKYWLIAIILLSIAGCFIVLGASPKTSFFMLPFRMWELGSGFLLGFWMRERSTSMPTKTSYIGITGLVVIALIPLIALNGKSTSIIDGHPGLVSLVIVVATIAVLFRGLPTFITVSQIAKPFIVLGKYSYSIYLVHFPIIVIYLSEPFEGTNLAITSLPDFLVIIFLILISAILLHHLVETRRHGTGIKRTILVPTATILALALIAPSINKYLQNEKDNSIFAATKDRAEYRCGKVFRLLNPRSDFCELARLPHSGDSVMLLGNSHADSIKTTFGETAKNLGINVHFSVSNRPLLSGGPSVEKIISYAIANKIDRIVLHYSPATLDRIGDKINQLEKTATANSIAVMLIDPVPTWRQHVPKALYAHSKLGEKLPEQTVAEYNENKLRIIENITSISEGKIKRFDVAPYFCPSNCKLVDGSGRPLYFDNGHLTLTGSRTLIKLFEYILK